MDVHPGDSSTNSLGNDAVLLGQTHDAVVGLAHATDLAADGVGLGTVGLATGLGVHIHDAQLHGGVILGVDDPVGRRAAGKGIGWSVIHSANCAGNTCFTYHLRGTYRSTFSPASFSILLG